MGGVVGFAAGQALGDRGSLALLAAAVAGVVALVGRALSRRSAAGASGAAAPHLAGGRTADGLARPGRGVSFAPVQPRVMGGPAEGRRRSSGSGDQSDRVALVSSIVRWLRVLDNSEGGSDSAGESTGVRERRQSWAWWACRRRLAPF